ncbi:hypothetical protein G6N74_16175 [Mesorhizobium sp. CGMCC 1.15528]|uniref:Uncharacterized protein n=1 Tax=Mesorhizobium zhangyense TaxID=1776730 RepID=A0A7C9VAN2_9HYPH|nr:hypothetical protein [Mesorhizobium zhangyense]NGN42606.1 hypothetical protein [Mesorhizobium zhangyense]
MNTIILFFRDRPAVRLSMSAEPVARKRILPVAAPANAAIGQTVLACRWLRNPANGHLECRWTREKNTVSEEGVSRSIRMLLAA